MKPSDQFQYIKNNQISSDLTSLVKCYLPLTGVGAFSLYQYFLIFFDQGLNKHRFLDVLDYLKVDFPKFQEDLAILTGLDLLVLYREDSLYKVKLNPPLSVSDFLSNSVLRSLLVRHVGEFSVSALEMPDLGSAENLSKSLSDVFSDTGELNLHKRKSKLTFNLDHFKKLMMKDGLRFRSEQEDIMALYRLSEELAITNWMDLYNLAKETADKGFIFPERIKHKSQQQQPSVKDWSVQEQIILQESKQQPPRQLLAQLKASRKAKILKNEEKAIDELVAQGFLNEVINLLLIYSFRQIDSANLNTTYLKKLANDFSYKSLNTAEDGLLYLRNLKTQTASSRQTKSKPSKQTVSSVPKWSNPDYVNNTTEAEKVELARLREEALARLRKEK